jgi:hypothetical protein
MTRIILETDASNLGKALTTSLFHVQSQSISCNRVADCMASHGVDAYPDGGREFWCHAPTFVNELVSGNLPGALSL